MPVFGKSLFETVLEGLHNQADEEEEDAPLPVRGFNGGFVGNDWSGRADPGSDPSLLFNGFAPDPVTVEAFIPGWIDRLSETEIKEDLCLKNCRTELDLRERRRLFALDNHPDRVPIEYREQANRRMMAANQMIDAALAKFR
ncbi:MAG: hypothetical protein JWM58_2391 [Rhizobium sp.]|nr:hypothetical protein [Rhizobium sp.]